MKRFISNILSFILMSLVIVFILFNILEFSIKKNTTIRYFNNSNYYNDVYICISNKLKDYILIDELSNDIVNILNINTIKKDIIDLFNNREINHDEDIKNIIMNYTEEVEIVDNYLVNINNIYKNNLFLINEFNMIYKLYLGIYYILFIDIILITLICSITVILYLINNNFNYHKISILSVSIFLILIFIIIKLIFSKFYYINNYYTYYIKHILNINLYMYVFISLILIVIFTINSVNNRNKNLKKNIYDIIKI